MTGMQTLRKFFSACLDPVVFVLLLLVVALVCLCYQRQLGFITVCVGVAVALLWLASFAPVSGFLLARLERLYPPILQPDPSVHWIVVLGASYVANKNLPENAQLTSSSMMRLIEAIRLYRQLPAAKIVLSGGGIGDDFPEPQRRQEMAKMLGVPADAMLLLPPSFNTEQEALYSKTVVGHSPFYLVSSASHLWRSMALFQRSGLKPIAAPTNYYVKSLWPKSWLGYLPSSGNIARLTIYLHEAVGYYWARWQGKL